MAESLQVFRSQSFRSKNVEVLKSDKSACFQNADFNLDYFYLGLGHHILKQRWTQVFKTLKSTFQRGNVVGSLPAPVRGKTGRIWQPHQSLDCAEGINLFQTGCLKCFTVTGVEHW